MAYFREFACDVSDFHGLKHIAGKGGLFRRLFWLICFFAATSVFLWQTVLLFQFYFDNHHITKVDVSYENDLEFPAITICNFNKYRESALTEDDIKNVGVHLGIIDEDHNLLYPDLYTEEFQNKLAAINWAGVEEDEDYNMTDFLFRTGHQLDDMLIECTWRDEECEDEYWTHVFTHLGNCFIFNKHSADNEEGLISVAAGPANGLKLMIDIEEAEYTPTNDLDGGAIDAGIMVMIHDRKEPPYVKEFALPTSPGLHTFMRMKHGKITALPEPYTQCEEDGEIQFYDHYTLSACRIECETDIVISACGCKLTEQPGDQSVCNPNKTHECAHPALVDAIHGTSEYGICECGSPCVADIFPVEIASAKLRASFVEKLFTEGGEFDHNASYIENNVVALSIYYDNLNYETIEQLKAMDVYTLLATVGGNMGLFIGAGLLTLIQLLEYFVDEILTLCGITRDNEKDVMGVCCGCTKNNKTEDVSKAEMVKDMNGDQNDMTLQTAW